MTDYEARVKELEATRAIRYEIRLGDSRDMLAELPDACVDALVTDPPAGISFMGKEWDHDHGGREGWCKAFSTIFTECLRVLKPGAHGLVWALPRTSHWTATALEDAGFEIRDVVVHLFGTGFPKSLDVSKAIDAAAGAELTGERSVSRVIAGSGDLVGGLVRSGTIPTTAPATPEAARWQGWGTALKPAAEHWILVRKPLDGTVAANVLKHGTGGLNVEGCRVGISKAVPASPRRAQQGAVYGDLSKDPGTGIGYNPATGRWPANVTLDEDAARMLDEQSGESASSESRAWTPDGAAQATWSLGRTGGIQVGHGDSGGASRFFYVAKAARSERDHGITSAAKSGGEATDREDGTDGLKSPRAGAGRNGGARNHHPTVKSVDLMRWLVRLITPPGGLVLDPFAGSGSTGIAAYQQGMRFLGFEREPEYHAIAVERLKEATRQQMLDLGG